MRRFVVGFLVLFTVVGLTGLDAWPLTGWQLFSRVRGPVQTGWEAVVVDAAGAERPVTLRGTLHVLQDFPRTSAEGRRKACAAWAAEYREAGVDVAGVRVYRNRSTVSLGMSPPTTVKARELRYTC